MCSVEIVYFKSQKHKLLVKYNGYIYRKDGHNDETSYWRCAQNINCHGRINLKNNSIIKDSSHKHCHVPDPAKIEATFVIQKIKEKALNSQNSPKEIIVDTVANSGTIYGMLPPIPNLKRTIQRQRQRNYCTPPNPTTLIHLGEIPEKYTTTANGDKFLVYDNYNINEPSNNRILIFCSPKCLDIMAECEHWFADGTFKSCPSIFSQIYTIHVLKQNTVIPTCFALLPSKTQENYNEVLNALKLLKPSINPKSILTDFEQGAINAFKECFPVIQTRGCHFHMSQCIWRKIQTISAVQEKYKSDSEFSIQIRLLAALAYVPVSKVVDGFQKLVESDYYQEHEEILQPLLDYFEDTWIGRMVRNRRRAPKFPLILWNCYEATKNGLPKTNNSIEGNIYFF